MSVTGAGKHLTRGARRPDASCIVIEFADALRSAALEDPMSTPKLACICIVLTWSALLAVPGHAQTLRVWGDDTYGQLSDAPDGVIKDIAGGSLQGLALRADKTPVLWGTGPIGPAFIPAELTADHYRAIAVGRDNAAMVRRDGSLVGFGRSTWIADVPSGSYRSVAVGAGHALAIAKDGSLKAWGTPGSNLLLVPGGGQFIGAEAVVGYSLALREDGTLFGWGSTPSGILTGWAATSENPNIRYRPGERYVGTAGGNVHALAIRPDGSVIGWGDNSGGALDAPPGVRFVDVAAGWGFSVGIAEDGTLWGWGTPFALVSPPSPLPTSVWTFASEGWTRHGESQHYYVAGERFRRVATAAFHIMAIAADDEDAGGSE
jgi:hypothetical protein